MKKSSLETFDVFDVDFDDVELVNKALGIIGVLSNNVRIQKKNGHTPKGNFRLFQYLDLGGFWIRLKIYRKRKQRD